MKAVVALDVFVMVSYTVRGLSVRKVFGHFEYIQNRLRGLGVTWQPVSGDLTVHP